MKIVDQWIVDESRHLILTEDDSYMLGSTSNVYGFSRISKEEALSLIEKWSASPFACEFCNYIWAAVRPEKQRYWNVLIVGK